jgi:hypothetical protein
MVCGAAMVSVSSAGASSTDPATCADGGWAVVQADDGATFASERRCVSYVHHGGTLYFARLVVVPFCFSTGPELEIVLFDFHPGAAVTLTLHGALWASNHSDTRTVTVTSDDGPPLGFAGSLIVQPALLMEPGASGVLVARDWHGLSAHVSFVNRCTA